MVQLAGIASLIIALAMCGAPAVAVEPLVLTQNGIVEGVEISGVESFKSIPFAAPPVGLFRWRPPQPAAAWSGIRPANDFSADCYQEPQIDPPPRGSNSFSEDCLYLNIWRPRERARHPLPVMVWIYGGSLINGAGSYNIYDGSAFARDGVILVTFNYRLGRFGFFAHPLLSAEQPDGPLANYGMMDQIAALRWVQGNISRFGGDPGNVTIFGQSAGAGSVNYLLTSPLARGLFEKAIAESSPSRPVRPLAVAESAGRTWADTVGATDLASLRALPSEKIAQGGRGALAADGKLILVRTDDGFRQGLAANVPYMLGSNSCEQSELRWTPGADEDWLTAEGESGARLLARYQLEIPDRQKALGQLWGDVYGLVPAHDRALSLSQRGQSVWLYHYAYVPDAAAASVPGASHGAEIEMVFKNPNTHWRQAWSTRDLDMARVVHGYWLNFAKNGNPNGGGLPRWPMFNSKTDEQMVFTPEGKAVASDKFAKARLDAIKTVLPSDMR